MALQPQRLKANVSEAQEGRRPMLKATPYAQHKSGQFEVGNINRNTGEEKRQQKDDFDMCLHRIHSSCVLCVVVLVRVKRRKSG